MRAAWMCVNMLDMQKQRSCDFGHMMIKVAKYGHVNTYGLANSVHEVEASSDEACLSIRSECCDL